jgi:hypothetical protein
LRLACSMASLTDPCNPKSSAVTIRNCRMGRRIGT